MLKFYVSVAVFFRILNFIRDFLTSAIFGFKDNFSLVLATNNVGGLGYAYRRRGKELKYLTVFIIIIYYIDYEKFNASIIWFHKNFSIYLGLLISIIVFLSCKNYPINELRSKRKNIILIEFLLFLCSTISVIFAVYSNKLNSFLIILIFISILFLLNSLIREKFVIFNRELLIITVLIIFLYLITIREIYEINTRDNILDTFFWLGRIKLLLLTFIFTPLIKNKIFYKNKAQFTLINYIKLKSKKFALVILLSIFLLLTYSYYLQLIKPINLIWLILSAGLLSILSSLASALYMPFLVRLRKSHILIISYAISCSWVLVPYEIIYNLFVIAAVKDSLLICTLVFLFTYRNKFKL